MMKNFSIFIICGLLFSCAFAYQPTTQDLTQVRLLKIQLDTITTSNMKGKRDFYAQLKTLQEQFPNHEQVQYYINELESYLMTQMNAEKVRTKIESKGFKQDFVNQWS